MKNNELYIYLHIPKCAGSTIRKHIVKNFAPNEALFLNYENIRLSRYINNKRVVYQKAAKRYLEKFSKKERAKIKLIYGETVPYGVHQYFNRSAKYVTFIRDPLKRTASLYNFFRTMYEREGAAGKKKDHFYLQLLVDGKIPDFETWLEKKYGEPDLAVESMYSFFKRFGYLDKDLEENSLKDQANHILGKFSYIGLTENPEDIYYFYNLLAIDKFFINQNISRKFVSYSNKQQSLLKKINKEDLILYKKAKKMNKLYKKKHPRFDQKAEQMVKKSKRMIPYTQLRYDAFESMRRLSIYLKKRSELYNRLFNMIRHKNE